MEFFYVVLGTSVWVLVDAKTIGVKKGQIKSFLSMGPWGWFFSCLFIWIIAFPAYVAKRSEYKKANNIRSDQNDLFSASNTFPATAQSQSTAILSLLKTVAATGTVMALLYLIASQSSIFGSHTLKEIPDCDSEQFVESLKDIISQKTSIEFLKITAQRNRLVLEKEHQIHPETGAEFSNCIAFANTDKGRLAFNVLMSKETPNDDVYFEYQEIDARTAQMAIRK